MVFDCSVVGWNSLGVQIDNLPLVVPSFHECCIGFPKLFIGLSLVFHWFPVQLPVLENDKVIELEKARLENEVERAIWKSNENRRSSMDNHRKQMENIRKPTNDLKKTMANQGKQEKTQTSEEALGTLSGHIRKIKESPLDTQWKLMETLRKPNKPTEDQRNTNETSRKSQGKPWKT